MIKQYQQINLDNASYQSIDLSGNHNFALIGITELTNISKVIFSTAIDSGVTGKPFVMANLSLDINGEVSGNIYTHYPEEFYIKPIQVVFTDGSIKSDGVYDIEVNINPLDLG